MGRFSPKAVLWSEGGGAVQMVRDREALVAGAEDWRLTLQQRPSTRDERRVESAYGKKREDCFAVSCPPSREEVAECLCLLLL